MNKVKPTLTIVMICHDDAAHLKRAIEKVKAATVEGVRLLFVDDSSQDGSFELATTLCAGFAEVVRTPSVSGVGGARNFGVRHLNKQPESERPNYIWFHDSDDYVSDDGIKRVMDALKEHPDVDCLSMPIGTLRRDPNGTAGDAILYQAAVPVNDIKEAANTAVSACSKVIKLSKFVPLAEGQMCEHVAWHYHQFDQFDSWAKVDGATPCYVWDRTNDKAISETVDFCSANSNTLEGLAFSNMLPQRGLKDRWVSDFLRGMAAMYDVRHELKKPWVRACWAARFKAECLNMCGGHFVH